MIFARSASQPASSNRGFFLGLGLVMIVLLGVTGNALAAAKPKITSPTTASGTVGIAFSYQITADQSITTWGASGLPAGLTVNTTNGLISGTPTVTGTFSVGL